MSFLAVADLSPKIQVALPHGQGDVSGTVSVMRISFDQEHVYIQLEPTGDVVCEGSSLDELTACFQRISPAPEQYLLTPMGNATVQRLVSVLDVCHQEGLSCSVARIQ